MRARRESDIDTMSGVSAGWEGKLRCVKCNHVAFSITQEEVTFKDGADSQLLVLECKNCGNKLTLYTEDSDGYASWLKIALNEGKK